jgi:hypothetical protein
MLILRRMFGCSRFGGRQACAGGQAHGSQCSRGGAHARRRQCAQQAGQPHDTWHALVSVGVHASGQGLSRRP